MEYVTTKEDYYRIKRTSLDTELVNTIAVDDPYQSAQYFVNDVEDHVRCYLMANTWWDGCFKNEFQKERFIEGVVEQIDYILNVGSIWIQKGEQQSTRRELLSIQLALRAKDKFRSCGLMNL